MQSSKTLPARQKVLKFNRSAFLNDWRERQVISDEHKSVLHYLCQQVIHKSVFIPGELIVDAGMMVTVDCGVIVRKNQYGNIKIDLFSEHENPMTGVKGIVMKINTITCHNIDKRELSVCLEHKRVMKRSEVAVSAEDAAWLVNDFTSENANTFLPTIRVEVSNMQATRFLQPRGPFYSLNAPPRSAVFGFFSMRHVVGAELFEFIHPSSFNTLEARMDIMLRCLHSVDKMMFQRKMLHLDLKPENIMVCTVPNHPNRMRITLIDGATMQKMAVAKSVPAVGTEGYMAPELMIERTLMPNADIYSLGIIFRILCDEANAVYFNEHDLTEEMREELYEELEGEIPADFPADDNANQEVYLALQHLLMQMSAADPYERTGVQECLESFETLYIQHRISQYASEEQAEKCAAVKAGLLAGFQFAKTCREYSIRELGDLTVSLKQFRQDLLNLVNTCKVSGCDITAFIWVQDEPCLFECDSFDEVSTAILQIFRNHTAAIGAWKKLITDLKMSEATKLSSDCETFNRTVIAPTTLTLENLQILTNHIHRKILKIKAQLSVMGNACASETDCESETKKARLKL